ncbi:MAG TPA: DEAD/DEAH box helicase [Phycisphaerales bacterium]|nr:DEAD/DEAH box helicase [Phycisphaerales bacterium]
MKTATPPNPAGTATRALELARESFSLRGWTPFDFQQAAWTQYLHRRSGLIHAPTGLGKTLAALMGPVCELAAELEERGDPPGPIRRAPGRARAPARENFEPLRILWITPLRALATDSAASIAEPVRLLAQGPAPGAARISVEMRTGDTPQSLKLKQKERLPTCLVTTPESLSLLLSYPGCTQRLSSVRCVIVDEWHELLGTKRGVQVELALARLRSFCPDLRTWGMSATLGNLEQAARVLLGLGEAPRGVLVGSRSRKRVEVTTLLPDDVERFTWAGHLGITLAPKVLDAVEHSGAQSTLLFTNTRSQAEIWFKRFLDERPDLLGHVAIHHGSLDRAIRERVEGLLDEGRLRCVVCTSSLDLGIDFRPVDQVIQLGSPKGVARLLQRAGRSGHRPGAVSRVLGVPTNAFELVEFAAVREHVERLNAAPSAFDRGPVLPLGSGAAADAPSADAGPGLIESRRPLDRPLDVLVQHLVTCAAGDGFDESGLRDEVRSTVAFERLSDREWAWAMDFVTRGGGALSAYPQYARIRPEPALADQAPAPGRFVIASDAVARLHRLTIGTISSSAMMTVKYTSGQHVGTIEEQFISRLEIGSRFILAGRVLELVRVRDMTAYVRRAPAHSGAIPKWDGGRMSLSTQLASLVRDKLDQARRGEYTGPEMACARPLLELQKRWSLLPAPGEVLIEHITLAQAEQPARWEDLAATPGPERPAPTPPSPADRRRSARVRRAERTDLGGHHAFVYLFDGRLVHEGLGALLSHRLTQRRRTTVIATATDQGFSLASADPLGLDEAAWRGLFTPDRLLEDLLACVNSSALARRQFRDIARVAGLIVTGYPGSRKPTRHLQASSEMFYDVFERFDAGNLLLDQARREVLDAQLEVARIRAALERLSGAALRLVELRRLSPLAFPIWAETLRATQVTSELWSDLVQKMSMRLEREAGGG